LIGHPQCPGLGPYGFFSMSVDRDGNAWTIAGSSATIYKLSTADASCEATSYVPCQQSICRGGMAFSFDTATGADRLFVNTEQTEVLARIDPTTLQTTVIGPVTPPPTPYVLELSGTGDGRLFAFDQFGPDGILDTGTREPRVLQLDPATANIVQAKDVELATAGNFAFAQWGGSFWLFTPGATPTQQRVTQFSWVTGQTLGFKDYELEGNIVGAGSSTCAPFLL
jgi:hypothetical protein